MTEETAVGNAMIMLLEELDGIAGYVLFAD